MVSRLRSFLKVHGSMISNRAVMYSNSAVSDSKLKDNVMLIKCCQPSAVEA